MTILDICNSALGDLGHQRTITSLSDGTAEASICALAYPRARLSVLGAHPWSFLTRVIVPSTYSLPSSSFLTSPSQPFTYARPPACLSIAAYDEQGVPVDYTADAQLIRSSTEITRLDCTFDNADPNAWPATVQEAVVAALAFKISGPLTGKTEISRAAAQTASAALTHAKGSDNRLSISRPGTPNRYATARQ